MGRNRKKINHQIARNKEHYTDRDVCKYNLVSFCPHDLFPNTKKDLGPFFQFLHFLIFSCLKRHDDFFKKQFLNDNHRFRNEISYIRDMVCKYIFIGSFLILLSLAACFNFDVIISYLLIFRSDRELAPLSGPEDRKTAQKTGLDDSGNQQQHQKR